MLNNVQNIHLFVYSLTSQDKGCHLLPHFPLTGHVMVLWKGELIIFGGLCKEESTLVCPVWHVGKMWVSEKGWWLQNSLCIYGRPVLTDVLQWWDLNLQCRCHASPRFIVTGSDPVYWPQPPDVLPLAATVAGHAPPKLIWSLVGACVPGSHTLRKPVANLWRHGVGLPCFAALCRCTAAASHLGFASQAMANDIELTRSLFSFDLEANRWTALPEPRVVPRCAPPILADRKLQMVNWQW